MRADTRHRDQRTAEHGAEQNRDEGAHFDDTVAADQFVLAQMLGQIGIFHRPEQG